MKWITLFALILSINTVLAYSKDEFCQEVKDPRYFQKQAYDRNNLLSFTNEGGAFDVGVCWWHSRFQRSAFYLARFAPELPRPSKSEAKKIIAKIKDRNQIVIIPGYSNLRSFSISWRDLIQKSLEGWQVINTLIFAWISGLTGVTENTPENMQSHMMDLSWRVLRGDIVYQKLQLKGAAAHAWLVVGFKRFEGGYELEVIDSNYGYVKRFTYMDGETGIFHNPYGGSFVPYIEREKELERMKKAVIKYCK